MNEAWVPEKLRERLIVGARVRYRVSAECPYRCNECGNDGHLHGNEGVGVIHRIDGDYHQRICTECYASQDCVQHIYGVRVSDSPLSGFWAAAIELEPLDSEDES